MELTLTERWLRVFEAGIDGVCYLAFAWFLWYLLTDKRCGQRKTVTFVMTTWIVMGLASLNTAVCRYFQIPAWAAFGKLPATFLIVPLTVGLIIKSAELREAWALWSKANECANDSTKVRIHIVAGEHGFWAKLLCRRRQPNDVTDRVVGSTAT